jgi:hypothetical protein
MNVNDPKRMRIGENRINGGGRQPIYCECGMIVISQYSRIRLVRV